MTPILLMERKSDKHTIILHKKYSVILMTYTGRAYNMFLMNQDFLSFISNISIPIKYVTIFVTEQEIKRELR